MSTITIPGVGDLTSSALTPVNLNVLFQPLILRMLGIAVDPANPVDPGYILVRVEWPANGQPDWKATDDVAFIASMEEDDEYNVQHEPQQPIPGSVGNYTRQTVYTRVWLITLTFYGPASSDHARQVKSCMFLDFVRDTLSASNLFEVHTLGTPRRSPELFQSVWYERTTFSFRLNEQVTETIILPAMQSVELIIEDAAGILIDRTINFPQ
jgi:hypothetical protein